MLRRIVLAVSALFLLAGCAQDSTLMAPSEDRASPTPTPTVIHASAPVDCGNAYFNSLGYTRDEGDYAVYEHYEGAGYGFSQTAQQVFWGSWFDESAWFGGTYEKSNGCVFKASLIAFEASGTECISTSGCYDPCYLATASKFLSYPYQGCYMDRVTVHYKVDITYQPVTVTIMGPSSISSAGLYTWTGNTVGGQGGTITMSWYRKDVGGSWVQVACQGSPPDCTFNVRSDSPSFDLRVDVVDHKGNSDSDTHSVTVDISEITASIDGPSTVNEEDEECSWNAIVSGGTTPYFYSWSGIASGSDSWVLASPSDFAPGGTLYLTVTDSSSPTLSDEVSLQVSVDSNNQQEMCTL